jgi:DNA repair protein RecO (recombination protein O)
MHKLFVTEGVVLGKRGVGEANVLLAILTKDLGLVKAVARSARRESSKLRYGLEPLTSATYSFIRGRHEWKLVGAERASAPLRADAVPLEARQAAGRATRLLLRLIHGEEENPALFAAVAEGLHAFARVPAQTAQIETVLVLRVLSHLGYLPQTPELKPFIERDFFAIELAEEVAASKALLNKAIQDSLSATGL